MSQFLILVSYRTGNSFNSYDEEDVVKHEHKTLYTSLETAKKT